MKYNLEENMQSVFTTYGLRFQLTDDEVRTILRGQLGEDRYQRYEELRELVKSGQRTQRDLYELMETPDEANTLVSLEAHRHHKVALHLYRKTCSLLKDASWKAARDLYWKIGPRLRDGSRIGVLGCSTGAFVDWIAQRHQNCHVIGLDNSPKVIQFARELSSATNATFLEWDSTGANPAPVGPCDVLTCGFGVPINKFYNKTIQQCFANWGRLLKPEGTLLMVPRVVTLAHAEYVIESAHSSAWTCDINESKVILADDLIVPFLHLRPGRSPSPLWDDIRAMWRQEDFTKS
jgi:SAM-dependent methyltransferase